MIRSENSILCAYFYRFTGICYTNLATNFYQLSIFCIRKYINPLRWKTQQMRRVSWDSIVSTYKWNSVIISIKTFFFFKETTVYFRFRCHKQLTKYILHILKICTYLSLYIYIFCWINKIFSEILFTNWSENLSDHPLPKRKLWCLMCCWRKERINFANGWSPSSLK